MKTFSESKHSFTVSHPEVSTPWTDWVDLLIPTPILTEELSSRVEMIPPHFLNCESTMSFGHFNSSPKDLDIKAPRLT